MNSINKTDMVSQKVVIIMGEYHTPSLEYENFCEVIDAQKDIINLAIQKYSSEKTIFYSEVPEENRNQVFKDVIYHSSFIVQNTSNKIKVVLSSVGVDDREKGSCDILYANDVERIFTQNSNIECIVVAIGLLHVLPLSSALKTFLPEIEIVMYNTCTLSQIMKITPALKEFHPEVLCFLKDYPPYKKEEIKICNLSSDKTYQVNISTSKYGDKIYICPSCKSESGSSAPNNPSDLDLHIHYYLCPNKGKYPLET